MKAVSIFSFHGNAALSQLSFPVGAEIKAKQDTNKGGWIYGSYAGNNGWFPVSYVELQSPIVKSGRQQEQERRNARYRYYPHPQTARSSISPSYDNSYHQVHNDIPPLTSIYFEDNNNNNSSSSNEADLRNQRDETCDFSLMGGDPGTLFGVSGASQMHPIQEESEEKAFQKQQQQNTDIPVDLYRHSPSRKTNYKSEYNPEISVQVPTKRTSPTFGYRPQVSPQEGETAATAAAATTSSEGFWKAHPGRAPGPSTADQAFELERAFDGINDNEKIEIVAEKRKKKLSIPTKKLKDMAKKTLHGLKIQRQ